MRTMILTGAGGFVGSDLLRAMRDRYRIMALARTRKENALHDPGVQYVYGDLLQLDMDSILAVLPNGQADIFVHAAGQAHIAQTGDAGSLFERNNVHAAEAALQLAVKAKVSKFILISSAVVYNDNPHDLYERSKREAEERIAQVCRFHGISYVMVRPFMVYGEREPSDYTSGMIDRIGKGLAMLPHNGRKVKPMVYIKNLSYLICRAVEMDTGKEAILLARDREMRTLRELYDDVRRRMERPCLFVPVPSLFVKAAIVAVHVLQLAGGFRRLQVRSLRHLNREIRYPMEKWNEALVADVPFTAEEGWSATVSSLLTGAFPITEDGVLQRNEQYNHDRKRRLDKAEPERSLPK